MLSPSGYVACLHPSFFISSHALDLKGAKVLTLQTVYSLLWLLLFLMPCLGCCCWLSISYTALRPGVHQICNSSLSFSGIQTIGSIIGKEGPRVEVGGRDTGAASSTLHYGPFMSLDGIKGALGLLLRRIKPGLLRSEKVLSMAIMTGE